MASEINPHARQLYELNFPNLIKTVLRGNVQKIAATEVPQHDILTAGFPCQSFTTSGDRRAFADPRGQLFWHIPRLLNYCRPSAFLLENVTGLVGNQQVFDAIVKELEHSGYRVLHRVINSNCLVPQSRDRVYIVGFRGNLGRFDCVCVCGCVCSRFWCCGVDL
jgi:DNA (cytosine-5)-methyltransferase 1